MAFGNPYSPGYMPGYYQMGQQMPPPMPDQLAQLRQGYQQPAQQQPTPIIWVQGEEGAKAYMVAAGNSVLLMDSENSVFYIKSTDASGMPQPLRIFDYTERGKMAPQKAEAAVQTAREAPARVRVSGGSDFMQAVAQVDFSAALDVLDELMSTLEIVNPKAYKSVMRRLDGLK